MIEEIKRQKDFINQKMAEEKGLIRKGDYTLYEKIERIYREGLYQVLAHYFDLLQCDKVVEEIHLDFGVVPEERKNPYQKVSPSKYFYIRNFLFIEKLEKEDIDLLKEKDEVDDTVLEVVKKTYPEIIRDNYRRGVYEDATTTCYGAMIPKNIIDSKNLVIAFHCGKNENIVRGKEFMENLKAQKFFIQEFSRTFERKLIGKLPVLVTVLEKTYVDYL